MKPAVTVTVVFLLLVAVLHLLRLVFSIAVAVDNITIPLWASIFASIAPAALAAWLWHEQRRPRQSLS